MKINPIRLALAVASIVSGVVRAAKAASEGGKKITRSEWDEILSGALAQVATVLEDGIGDLVER